MIVVVKIGTSSLTDEKGTIQERSVVKLCDEVAALRAEGHDVVVVTSGAISAGLPAMGYAFERPKDTTTLQAAAAVGQSRLLRHYDDALGRHGLIAGQILISPDDFFNRRRYLHARSTFVRLLELGIVPIVNENDAVADDEIRLGDNDRIAALVAHAVAAELLVLLTDTAGLFTADPRLDASASLIEEIVEVDNELEARAGGAGTARGSGGMASKLSAARMAAWSGVATVIAASGRENVLVDAVHGASNVGTVVLPRRQRLSARKLWIAFAMPAAGHLVVDDGARLALTSRGSSLLPAGVLSVEGDFSADSGVEVLGGDGSLIAKGVSRYSSTELITSAGKPRRELATDLPDEVIHRDDLVLLT